MSESDRGFHGSIPELYDRLLVPLIFESFAEDLAIRTARGAPRRVLETAAGTGVVTRALTRHLAPDAVLVASDLNVAMLDCARAQHMGPREIEWAQADALDLPFDDASFDAVVCQFGVMFFPDRVTGFAEARRVLRPGGRFLFNVWDRIETNEFAHAVTEALAELWPSDPPRFLARTPHGHGNPDQIERDLAAAGFGSVGIELRTAQSRAATARHPAQAYCEGTPLRSEIEARDPGGLGRTTDHAARAIARRWGDGPVSAQIQGYVVQAAAPA